VQLMRHVSLTVPQHALLHHVGIPSRELSCRLDAGDVVLFSSTHLLAYGTKLFTMCKVLPACLLCACLCLCLYRYSLSLSLVLYMCSYFSACACVWISDCTTVRPRGSSCSVVQSDAAHPRSHR
jgi:hypothetical protein